VTNTDVVATDVYEEYQQELEAVKNRIAAFMVALERIKVDPINDDVVATFDSDGYLADLYIDPTAMRRYTNVELEELIGDVLRGTEKQMNEAVRELIEQYGLSDLLKAPDLNVLG
jgi:hypothetical protein